MEAYREEASNLANKLKVSLDTGLLKDNTIHVNIEQIEGFSNELNKCRQELANIYKSEGFRFVLNPLWKIIWHSRSAFKYSLRKLYDFMWSGFIVILTPVILCQVLFFLAERIGEILFGWASVYFRRKRRIIPFDKLSVSVVIPNWNGVELLKKCLASLYVIDEFKSGQHEVLVIDDASKYDILQQIKDDFPKVRVIRNFFNKGFGRSCNRGVKNANGELIVLLNNDIIVSENFLKPLKEHFRDDDVFAVSPKLYYWDKKTFNYGMHMGRFENGYLSLWNEAETGNGDKVSRSAPTIFAVGGAMCFRKRDFLWLGGFDDIYRPNCWEDIDISYRAQKRGLKVLYEPNSLAYHKGAATLNYVRHKEIKNELLFMWKNINDPRMLLSNLNCLPKFLFYGKHSSRVTFLLGYLWALNHFISALAHKFSEVKYFKVTDRKVLNRPMLYYRNFRRCNYAHTDKKTILLVTPFMLSPLVCGGKLRIYNFYKRLSKKYNLILLSLIHDEKERGSEYVQPLKEIFSEVHLIHDKTPSSEFLFPWRYKYSFSTFFIEKLKEIQEKSPVDLVHLESNEILYLGRYIKYAPVVYTEHDVSILSYKKSYYKKSINDSILELVDYLKVVRHHHSVYKRLDRAIALSKEDIKILKAFSPCSSYSLISTGVDLEHFYFREKISGDKSLIFVGHYPHYPNEDAAVYFCKFIFPLIKNEMPEVTLRLVGSSPTEEIFKLSAIEGVEVVGTVLDVNAYLQKAGIFVSPFRIGAGIKGKVLEAMAAGIPVVSTTRGSYGINALNGHNILIADSPDDFAKNVIRIFKEEDLYKKLSRNGRLLTEKEYDWDRIAGQLDRVYMDVMLDTGFSPAGNPDCIGNYTQSKAGDAYVEAAVTPTVEPVLSAWPSEASVLDIIQVTDKIIETSLD